MIVALQKLREKGFETESLGLFENDCGKVENADVLLMPVPTTRDGKNVFCPLTDRKIPFEIVDCAPTDALILSCGYFFEGKNCIDYLNLDSFCLANAVPTAEGAIAKAITDTPFCLWKSRVLVIGNGRVGKILAARLKALECEVTVAARKDADFAYIEALGMKYIHTKNVLHAAKDFDIIFNTIDIPVFEEIPNKLKGKFIYDLSTKGCIDYQKAQNMGINAVKLPGLPGKTAPQTAGEIIAQTVTEILQQGAV